MFGVIVLDNSVSTMENAKKDVNCDNPFKCWAEFERKRELLIKMSLEADEAAKHRAEPAKVYFDQPGSFAFGKFLDKILRFY